MRITHNIRIFLVTGDYIIGPTKIFVNRRHFIFYRLFGNLNITEHWKRGHLERLEIFKNEFSINIKKTNLTLSDLLIISTN